ncbi:biopolymer transporter ExbD [Compostibacter hankyongensis]|uniref:Biopolymer transporter ExbD n=1 Tax=Compostibacter hankyongensis TaxID=1007089 RepID=A0ABP8FUK7_9BACT
MPKVKIARKSTLVDMTPMCDVAFLLLTFFMLTTKFKPEDPVAVVTPTSISQKLLPEEDVAMIIVGKNGQVFYGLDDQNLRVKLIQAINQQYNLGLSNEQMKKFSMNSSFGVPIPQLKQFLSMSIDDQKAAQQPGIPYDSANNELAQWIKYTVSINAGKSTQFCIKADVDTKFPKVNEVLKTLKLGNHMKLHLITDMKAPPAGTPAAMEAQKGGGSEGAAPAGGAPAGGAAQ